MPSGTLMKQRAESNTERGLELTVQLFHRPQTLDRLDKCVAIGVDPGATVEVCARIDERGPEFVTLVFAEKGVAQRVAGLTGGEKLLIRALPVAVFAGELIFHVTEVVDPLAAEAQSSLRSSGG